MQPEETPGSHSSRPRHSPTTQILTHSINLTEEDPVYPLETKLLAPAAAAPQWGYRKRSPAPGTAGTRSTEKRRAEQAGKLDGTKEGLRMDLISSPPDLFHPALPDANVNSSQHPWRCTHHKKKIRAERGAMSKRDVGPTALSQNLFPILLIVGWIAGCTAVVYFVFIFAWKRGVRERN